MSIWHSVKSEEIDIDNDEQEISFFVWNNHNGNIYAVLTFEQIKKIYDKIKDTPEDK